MASQSSRRPSSPVVPIGRGEVTVLRDLSATLPYDEHLRRLPKCELHCHIEGCVRPTTVVELAVKNGVTLPTDNPEELYRFTGLRHFLNVYSLVCQCFVSFEDFRRLAYESIVDAARAG